MNRLIKTLLFICFILFFSFKISHASQIEEPLAQAVRSALNAAITNSAPPIPIFFSEQEKINYQLWLTVTSKKLEKKITSKNTREEFLQTVWYESKRSGLDVSLVLGLIQVESAFRKHAISISGARGYMQVMPFWMRLIGNGDASNLFHMQTNIRFGTIILRHYLDIEKGNLFMALGRFNGSRGKEKYPNLVLNAQKNWILPNNLAQNFH